MGQNESKLEDVIEEFERIDREHTMPLLETNDDHQSVLYMIIQMYQRDPLLRELMSEVLTTYESLDDRVKREVFTLFMHRGLITWNRNGESLMKEIKEVLDGKVH